ncbi:hypothetical protein BVRB_4g086720 [Beta vulgaris subsp. vulgaris]|nr:hypothetical protein BVRB_4g086720 [Beta vulgaris subsp. vulgaris]
MKTTSRSSKHKKTKHSQKRSKKRTKSSRVKTKKSKQQDHSISCSDEDLASTSSVSCSCPRDDRKSKKRGRSKDRRNRKDKKRIKKSSLMSGSSEDDSPRVKKSKKSKKSRGGSDSRKKRHVKRRKRDRSVSPSSSRSRSCDDNEGEVERKKEKVESKERKGREKSKERGASKRSRHRSRSGSLCSLHSESSTYCSEERVLEKNVPMRLKSVIVVKESEVFEEEDSNRDDRHEDEIVCEFDDYPSKSNDSNDVVSGREAISNSHDVSSERMSMDEPIRDCIAYDAKSLKVPIIQREVVEGSPTYVRSRVDDPLIENKTATASSSHYDLEAILRQKALENLLKRQGELCVKMPGDRISDHDIEVKKSSNVKARPVKQHISHDKGNIKSTPKGVNVIDDVRYTGPSVNTGLSIDNDSRLPSVKVETSHPEDKGKPPCDFVDSRPNVSLSTPRKELLGAKNTWKRQLIAPESSLKNLSAPREMTVKDSKKRLISQEYSEPKFSAPQKTISKDSSRESTFPRLDSKGGTEKVDDVVVSEASASVEQNTNEQTDKGEEEAQFQQKTMSVKRGGEMVQVSYKVYIPKKAPALARRQLKR